MNIYTELYKQVVLLITRVTISQSLAVGQNKLKIDVTNILIKIVINVMNQESRNVIIFQITKHSCTIKHSKS